ncbi:MAG: glutamine synthetase family protein [Ilumatobacteraceae bacterium]
MSISSHQFMTLDAFRELAVERGIHTVEVAAPDTQGHLRGKRVPVQRFIERTVTGGVNIADAMFVFDMQNDLPDNEFVNMETGYLDCKLVPDVSTLRIFSHRPGYAIVFADAFDPHGAPHGLAPRSVLARQIERCEALGFSPVVATELEFYLCLEDWSMAQTHIQYSSLTDGLAIEAVLKEMRDAIAAVGIEVESSNAEYGPGQFELNTGPMDAMTCADNTVLFKSIVKQVAQQHGVRATFMPKPYADQSGSGMHVHTSLNIDGRNAFAEAAHAPNELMAKWLAGQVEHAVSMTLLGAPTINGVKRIRPYTFAPTHAHWGLDNRTVLARCIVEPGSSANRIEYRNAGADANPHALIAALLAAGADGIERGLTPPPMSSGDMYGNPGDCPALPTDLGAAVAAFEGSAIAAQLGEMFARSYVSIARHEVALGAEHSPDPDEVNDWERQRYMEHC